MTYYDDPDLAGAQFRPEVYISDRGGTTGLAFTPANIAVALEGTGTWRDAYFEIRNVKLSGVNQGPQAAARFVVTDKVFFSRVRYGVIRPCGPDANVNPLAGCKPAPEVQMSARRNASGSVRLAWPASAAQFTVQESDDLNGAWRPVTAAPVADGEELVLEVTPAGTRFYRLIGQ
jgi:hypothetical protein